MFLSNKNLAWRRSYSTYCRSAERTKGSHSVLAVPAGCDLPSSEASFRHEPCLVHSRLFVCFVDASHSLCRSHISACELELVHHTLLMSITLPVQHVASNLPAFTSPCTEIVIFPSISFLPGKHRIEQQSSASKTNCRGHVLSGAL